MTMTMAFNYGGRDELLDAFRALARQVQAGELKPGDSCLMSGTFVGPNNYACFLGMAVVAALALLFGDSSSQRNRRRHHHEDEDEGDGGETYGHRREWLTGGNMALGAGANLLTLKFSRDDETEADIVGLELAARAGYNPSAGVTLWRKMQQSSKGAPPQWLSTHPSGDTRIHDIEARLPRVEPLYEAAPKPTQRFAPPPLKSASAASG